MGLLLLMGGGFSGALDNIQTGLFSAWSISRRLRTAYSGSIIRIRRSSDNAEQNIGWNSSGFVDLSAISLFCGSGDGFVTTIYDQSGGSRNFTQSTTTLQPIVYEAGTAVTRGGRLAAKFVAADARRMAVSSSTATYDFISSSGASFAIVSSSNDTAAAKFLIATRNGTGDVNSPGFRVGLTATEQLQVETSRLSGPSLGTSVSSTETTTGNTANCILAIVLDPSNATAASRAFGWRNGTALVGFANAQTGTPAVENAAIGNLTLGSGATGLLPHDGTIQECVIWSNFISNATRDLYESNAGAFYGITVA